MIHLPYLQPLNDVNKRVSRLAANIPFIKCNLSPLVFSEVPIPFCTAAIIGAYELSAADPLKDVYLKAYAGQLIAIRPFASKCGPQTSQNGVNVEGRKDVGSLPRSSKQKRPPCILRGSPSLSWRSAATRSE